MRSQPRRAMVMQEFSEEEENEADVLRQLQAEEDGEAADPAESGGDGQSQSGEEEEMADVDEGTDGDGKENEEEEEQLFARGTGKRSIARQQVSAKARRRNPEEGQESE